MQSPPRKLVHTVQGARMRKTRSTQKLLLSLGLHLTTALMKSLCISHSISEREICNGNIHISLDSQIGDLQNVCTYLFIAVYHDGVYINHMRFTSVFFFCPSSQWPYPTQILLYMMQDDSLSICCPV